MLYFWKSKKKEDLKIYNAKKYKCKKVNLKIGSAYINPDEYEKEYFSGIIYKGLHNVGFLKDFQPSYYDKEIGKTISKLFALRIYDKYKGKNIASNAISGLVGIIKENYGLSCGLKLESVITNEGKKAFLKIAQRLKEDGVIAGYDIFEDEKLVSEFQYDDLNKDNFIFLKF